MEELEELTEALNPYEFAEHLKEGVLLNDLTFQGKRHGSLIHMWHVDMMIYLAKSMKKILRLFLSSIDGWERIEGTIPP